MLTLNPNIINLNQKWWCICMEPWRLAESPISDQFHMPISDQAYIWTFVLIKSSVPISEQPCFWTLFPINPPCLAACGMSRRKAFRQRCTIVSTTNRRNPYRLVANCCNNVCCRQRFVTKCAKAICQAKSSIKIGRGGTYWSIFFAILLAVSQLNARCQQETIFFTTERCGSANVGHNKSLCLLKVGHDEALYFFEGWSYHEILIPQRLDTTKWCGSSKVGQRELLQECLLTKRSISKLPSKRFVQSVQCVYFVYFVQKSGFRLKGPASAQSSLCDECCTCRNTYNWW